MNVLKWLFGGVEVGAPEPAAERPTYDGHTYDIGKHGCPDCGGEEFIEGPSGGACTNICCMKCHNAFNIAPGLYTERISNGWFQQFFTTEVNDAGRS